MEHRSKDKKLFLFTHCFPWDRREHFVDTELKYFSKVFDSITIIPMTNGSASRVRPIPSNVNVRPFLIPWNRVLMFLKGILNLSPFFFCFKEIKKEKLIFQPRKLRNCLIASLQIRGMLSSRVIKKLHLEIDSNSVCLFNWGIGPGFLVPFLPVNKKHVFVRFHGGDLYEWRSGGYIPYRSNLLENLNTALFISKDGQRYLHDQYREINFQSKVFRIGIEPITNKSKKKNKIFHIVSCSDLLPVKRISLVFKALKMIDEQVSWTHIGGGEQLENLKKYIDKYPDNINIKFVGVLSNEKVREIYSKHTFDVFINVSLSEGIPVSIMEALSAGVPIIATDVGGVSEIVDEKVGYLLPKNIEPCLIARELIRFKNLSEERHLQLRINAIERYNKRCNAGIVYKKMADYLLYEICKERKNGLCNNE